VKSDLDFRKDIRSDLNRLPRLDASSVRSVRRRYSAALKTSPLQEVINFVKSLLDDGGWAERVVAWAVLAEHPGAFALVDDRLAEEMAEGLSDWGSVDLFGVTVLGQAWRERLVSDSRMIAWAKSTDRWLRRLSLVATVPPNSRARGGKDDSPRTLRITRLLKSLETTACSPERETTDFNVGGLSTLVNQLKCIQRVSVKSAAQVSTS
jgi:hypothetical protein